MKLLIMTSLLLSNVLYASTFDCFTLEEMAPRISLQIEAETL